MQNDKNNNHMCDVHEKTVELIEKIDNRILEHEKELHDMREKDNMMVTSITNIEERVKVVESYVAKARKYGLYCILVFIGNFVSNPGDWLDMFGKAIALINASGIE